jgi:hypothetical protein
MVVCGSAGTLEEVADTVDASAPFFFPKRLNMLATMK